MRPPEDPRIHALQGGEYVKFANVAAAQLACRSWNTKAFFTAATVADVSRCLEAGANIEARSGKGNTTPLHLAAYGTRLV